MSIVLFSCLAASADVSIVIEEAVGPIGEFAGTGHAALYFSNLCAQTPVQLRPCAVGEQGAVVSTYQNLGDNGGYQWLALPWIGFLQGVDSPEQAPLYTNKKVEQALQARYRAAHLDGIIPAKANGELPSGRWRELVASGLRRDVYLLTIATTAEQDAAFLRHLTQAPNTYNFNVLTNNCSDFVSETVNAVFPNATRRDLLNDFGVATPKAIARSFISYANAHPELQLSISKYSQSDQTVRRSTASHHLSEEGVKSKKYLLLAGVTQPVTLAALGGLYFVKGRFNLDAKISAPPSDEAWSTLQKQANQQIDRAIESGLFTDRKQVSRFHRDIEDTSTPAFDANGNLTLWVQDETGTHSAGITPANIRSAASDATLAYKLLLSRLAFMASSDKSNRPSLQEMQQTWDLLQSLPLPSARSATR